jgi:hypothetical protein
LKGSVPKVCASGLQALETVSQIPARAALKYHPTNPAFPAARQVAEHDNVAEGQEQSFTAADVNPGKKN